MIAKGKQCLLTHLCSLFQGYELSPSAAANFTRKNLAEYLRSRVNIAYTPANQHSLFYRGLTRLLRILAVTHSSTPHTHTHTFLRLCTDRISLMRFSGVNDVMLAQASAAAIFSWFGCFWSDLWWFVCTEGSWDIPVLLFALLLCDSDGLNCA